MMNINIQQIDNGFLVATPPSRLTQEMMMKQGHQPQPVVTYCKDYEAVCAAIKASWPISITDK